MASYPSKHASESLSDKLYMYMCTCTHNLKTTGPIWTLCISIYGLAVNTHKSVQENNQCMSGVVAMEKPHKECVQ